MVTSAPSTTAAQFDITSRLSECLDPHMVLPMLDWMQEQKFYDHKTIQQAKIDLVNQTMMVEYAGQLHEELHGKELEGVEGSKQKVLSELTAIHQSLGPLGGLLNQNTVEDLRANHNWTLEHLSREYGVTNDHVEQFFRLAKTTFECGGYVEAANYLSWFKALIPAGPLREGTEMVNWEEYRFAAMWGKLSAEIVNSNFEVAMTDLLALKEAIDGRSVLSGVTPAQQLQQRVWLAHWSLFIFFNMQDGLNRMLDLLTADKLLAAISHSAPHLLRYLVVAAIFNRRRRLSLTDLARTIATVRETYTDPVLEFVHFTIGEFDFDHAAEELKKISTVVQYDFFLSGYIAEGLLQNARLLLFETYSRIYKFMDINSIAQRLDISQQDVDLKLVEYIRSTKIDAKIDSKNHVVVVATPYPTIYQQVIDKTKAIAFRSQQLALGLEKKFAQQRDERD